MKTREQRRKVFVPARIRCAGRWDDVRVLDVSSRGFLLQAGAVPDRGTYVELCRGRNLYVARVVWAGQQRFGVRTQDRVGIEAFLAAPGEAADEPVSDPERDSFLERRSVARRREATAQGFEQNRAMAKAMEFGSLVGMGGIAAVLILGLLHAALARPLAQISAALALN